MKNILYLTIRLFLSLLNKDYEKAPVNLIAKEQKDTNFLDKNNLGQVPVLEDNGEYIRDSQAILVYLARKYGGENWLSTDPVKMAKVLQWLFTASNEIANSFALARASRLFGRQVDQEVVLNKAVSLLSLMEKHFDNRVWLETDQVTIADYPNVKGWLNRIISLPGFVAMPGIMEKY